VIPHASVLMDEGEFRWVGPDAEFDLPLHEDVSVIDATGLVALPGFVDSHTHLLFAGSREDEFAMRAEGKTYQEIGAAGGGILSTVRATRAATKKDLKRTALRRLDDLLRAGTTTVEIKSGYGLTEDDEIKMLDAIHDLQSEHYSTIVPTFLGAHAIPPEFASDPDGYVDLLCGRLLPYIAKRHLAVFCDAFCDTGYFTPAQTRRLLEVARSLGLKIKLHADQLSQIGASRLASELGAISIDHLEHLDAEGIRILSSGDSIATVLPGVSFFLHDAYPPARAIIDAGMPLAIASNFNPGSCMSYSMPLMMTIACTQMGMTPEEAITAATLNGAAALGLSDRCGSVEPGKEADLILYRIPNYRYLIYHFGVNHVASIIKHGVLLEF
jgi:imidazolonepropionase